jgi:hypothetical protein
MPMFTREESLLVRIHEKQAVEERHLPTLTALLSAGWVTATQNGEGQYSDIALTPRGQAKVDEAIFRD